MLAPNFRGPRARASAALIIILQCVHIIIAHSAHRGARVPPRGHAAAATPRYVPRGYRDAERRPAPPSAIRRPRRRGPRRDCYPTNTGYVVAGAKLAQLARYSRPRIPISRRPAGRQWASGHGGWAMTRSTAWPRTGGTGPQHRQSRSQCPASTCWHWWSTPL
eukprot:SAG31_NODE_1099_length_9914_cov_6.721345_12_plen_163_part_00